MKEKLAYERTYILQAAHFNGAKTYEHYWRALGAEKQGEWQSGYQLLKDVVADCHGHNFKVVVRGEGVGKDDQFVVVWDEVLEEIVRKWDNTNLSVHPDFTGKRATTELMCAVLKKKLERQWPRLRWVVAIWETDQIRASLE